MGGERLSFLLAPQLFDPQVVPALEAGVREAAVGEAGQRFRPGQLPFRPLGRALLDLRPATAGARRGCDPASAAAGNRAVTNGVVCAARRSWDGGFGERQPQLS